MEYKGIKFEVKMGVGRDEWVWTIYTPTPKQGNIRGIRDRAVLAAQKAIKSWCYKNPLNCSPYGGASLPN